jgi:hypothetical protein
MLFDAALAAQDTFRRVETELGSDWDAAVELENTFPPTPESSPRHPLAFCNLVGYISFGDQWIQTQRA